MKIYEGMNRQIRRMTAQVGHPTLRIIRTAIGSIQLGKLAPGEWRVLSAHEFKGLSIPTRKLRVERPGEGRLR